MRTHLLILPILAAVCVPAVTAQNSLPSQPVSPNLLLLSRPIAGISSRLTFYFWQSNHSFLQVEIHPHPGMKQVDVRTGTAKRLTGLERRLGRAVLYPCAVSPDGKKVLWEDADRRSYVHTLALESVAPISSRPLNRKFWVSASDPIWMPDSKRWIQLFAADRGISAIVGEESSPKPVQEIEIGSPRGTASGYDLMRTRLLGCTQAGRVLATPAEADVYPNAGPSRQIRLFEFSLDSAHPNVREYVIELPCGEAGYEHNTALGRGEDVALSPRGDRLAWLLYRKTANSKPERFDRRPPGRIASPHLFTEIRITDLNGSGGKTVGTVDFDPSSKAALSERPFRMQWLPDGRHISFVFHGTLRMISAR